MKPRIGVTSGLAGPEWGPGGTSWDPYADAVAAAGGEPIHLASSTRGREAEVLSDLQGILFSGGLDVHLSNFRVRIDLEGLTVDEYQETYRMEPEPQRDAYELPLLDLALQRDLPILGICRGCQLLNVGMGGGLILDIPLQTGTRLRHAAFPPPERKSSAHSLSIEPGTLLASYLDPLVVDRCNSRHHQAIPSTPATGLRVSAVSPDDRIVEAVETLERRWVIGVQWHPEHRLDPEVRRLSRPLFTGFVEACT